VTIRGLLCVAPLRVLRHRPARRITALGSAFVCEDCSTSATTELGLMGDDDEGYVNPERRLFERDERYQRGAAA